MVKHPLKKFCKWLNSFLAVLCIVVGVSVVLKTADNHLLNVVDEFSVESIEVDQNSLLLNGTLNKVRQCTPLNVIAMLDGGEAPPHVAPLQFPIEKVFSRPPIKQSWGPWRVEVASLTGSLHLYANHRCHFMWDTTTHLTSINLDTLKEEQ